MQTVDDSKIGFERASGFFRAEPMGGWPELMEICRPKEVASPSQKRPSVKDGDTH